jgi:hypothetical protein
MGCLVGWAQASGGGAPRDPSPIWSTPHASKSSSSGVKRAHSGEEHMIGICNLAAHGI